MLLVWSVAGGAITLAALSLTRWVTSGGPRADPGSDVRFLTVYFVLFASVQVALLAPLARRLVGLAQPAKRVEVNGAAPYR